MYNSKSYRKGPNEPHIDNNQKQSTRSSRSQFKVSKSLNKNPYGSTKSSRIEKMVDCDIECMICESEGIDEACMICDECNYGGGGPQATVNATGGPQGYASSSVPVVYASAYNPAYEQITEYDPNRIISAVSSSSVPVVHASAYNPALAQITELDPNRIISSVASSSVPVVHAQEGYGTAIAAWGPEACGREAKDCFSRQPPNCTACGNFQRNCIHSSELEFPPECGNVATYIEKTVDYGPSAVGYGTAIDSVVSAEGYGTAIKAVEHLCPPCGNDIDDDMVPVLRNQVAKLRQELDHAKLRIKGPTQEAKEYMLKDTELFNLVSNFLVPPTHVFFGVPGVPKTLFKTQGLVCGKPGKLRFWAIHENIISNQFRLGRQKMKFFGYNVKGWQSDMSENDASSLSDATEATCLRGKHAIYVTHEELESIKIRYVRRFFYVYYGLVVKEIGEHKRTLMNLARTLKVSKAAAAAHQAGLLEAYTRVRENFFGAAIPYHLDILQKLNDRLIELGGIQNHIEDSLFTFITSQRSHFDKEIERLSNMNIAPTENQNDSTAGNPVIPGESWFLQAPPSAAEDEHFKTLAKAVISTLIGDQAPPQLFYEEMFGEEWLTEIVEVGNEIGININPTTKWSVIIPAVMNSWDNDALAGQPWTGPSWIKSQIMTWGSYILRHMQNEEEWIISKMGALLSGGKYSNSEGVIMASQFLTILGKSVGLTRAQAVQEVQEASGRVNDLTDNTASLNEQITDLQAHIRGLETDVRNMEDGAAATAAERDLALQIAEGANNTLQNISTSWAHFMGSIGVGGDIPYPTSLHNAPISSAIDYVKTELVKKLDEMKTLKERLASGTEDLEKARADLSTAQDAVTRLDGELIKTNVSLEDALANPDCSAAEASVRELLSGNIVALEEQIGTKTDLLKTRLDKITELEKTAVAKVAAAMGAAGQAAEMVKKVEKKYKKKIEDAEETSAAAIKQKNMIIIGLAIFILILIIVVIVK